MEYHRAHAAGGSSRLSRACRLSAAFNIAKWIHRVQWPSQSLAFPVYSPLFEIRHDFETLALLIRPESVCALSPGEPQCSGGRPFRASQRVPVPRKSSRNRPFRWGLQWGVWRPFAGHFLADSVRQQAPRGSRSTQHSPLTFLCASLFSPSAGRNLSISCPSLLVPSPSRIRPRHLQPPKNRAQTFPSLHVGQLCSFRRLLLSFNPSPPRHTFVRR